MRTLWHILTAMVLAGLAVVLQPAAAAELHVAAVMAPLSFLPPNCSDFDGQNCSIVPKAMQDFDDLVASAKQIGATTVSVDVWWRLVEGRGDGQFDWRYYDQIFQHISQAGLKIVPILSFHRCGTGPNDGCNFPLPDWLWTQFTPAGLSAEDLKYESEAGTIIDDSIPPWATARDEVLAPLVRFMRAFNEHYAGYAGSFGEINISLGPTGELRYPAYDSARDHWNYPDRGNFQVYSRLAQADFRAWALRNFGGLAGVASRWGITLQSEDEIRVPNGDRPASDGRRSQDFINRHDYQNTQYGRDFIDWYNQSLVDHGRRMLVAAHGAFDGQFDQRMASIPLGMKIPGVHWQITCTDTPRIAEITAGLVQTSLNLEVSDSARPDAYGYRGILDMAAGVERDTGRPIIVHFTALEMDNSTVCSLSSGERDTSMAMALVFWISAGAQDRNLTLRGENALPCIGDQSSPHGRSWDRIENAFQYASYSGLTFLRLTDTAFLRDAGRPAESCEAWNGADRSRYQRLITQFMH